MMKLQRVSLAIFVLAFATSVQFLGAAEDYIIEEATGEIVEEVPVGNAPINAQQSQQQKQPQMQSQPQNNGTIAPNKFDTDEYIIPNNPILKATNIITIRAIGMGVAPENTISPAQALVLAKRAAIADAYRQLGEKMYGIRVTAKDTVKDAVIKNSQIRTHVNGIIRNAEIMETVYQDGLCQVEMELKLDGRRWYRVLSAY